MDLSFPPGCSVNADIARSAQFNFSLPSVSMLTNRLSSLGHGTWLWLADLARAYRQLRACSLSIPLLGVMLNDQYYVDISLLFGCRMSSLACAWTTHALVWLLRTEGFNSICYLDDFTGLEATKDKAEKVLRMNYS